MNYNAEQANLILETIKHEFANEIPPELKLKRIWWILVGLRARYLASIVRGLTDGQVLGGPFKGMKLTTDAIAGYNACLLLGSYEHELHKTFEKIINGNYTRILNIGCSVGYYAVGLALRMPHIVIDAFDTEAEARHKCAEMAELNGVKDRVRISGEFNGADFATYVNERTLALVDIEGAERQLLDPDTYPALRKIDIVVELHDIIYQGISGLIRDRFSASHTIEIIPNQTALPDVTTLLPGLNWLDPFDHLLMGWEGRDGPTPWGVFMHK